MDDKRYYIAYGSNMSEEQMAFRTPDATILGTGMLEGWELRFCRYATIVPKVGARTPILVWEISPEDEERLDAYEGYPSFYYKKDLEVDVTPLNGGKPIRVTAMVYIMDEKYPLARPYPPYYQGIEDAYDAFDLPKAILEDALRQCLGAP